MPDYRRAFLPGGTFFFTPATQAFVEPLVWAAGDSKRRGLDEMQRYAGDSECRSARAKQDAEALIAP